MNVDCNSLTFYTLLSIENWKKASVLTVKILEKILNRSLGINLYTKSYLFTLKNNDHEQKKVELFPISFNFSYAFFKQLWGYCWYFQGWIMGGCYRYRNCSCYHPLDYRQGKKEMRLKQRAITVAFFTAVYWASIWIKWLKGFLTKSLPVPALVSLLLFSFYLSLTCSLIYQRVKYYPKITGWITIRKLHITSIT